VVDDDHGTDAARARVAALLDSLSRVDLQVVVVAKPDQTRLEARDRATEAAILAGRGALLYETTAAVRAAVLGMFARAGFSGTWAVTDMAVSVTRADDRVAAAAAFEEAAMAAVVEDLVDTKTLTILRSSAGELTNLTGIPVPGSLSAFASPASGSVRGPVGVAVMVGYTVFCVVVTVLVGVGVGLLALAVGVGTAAALSRRRRQRKT
jgi:hypothetical protein